MHPWVPGQPAEPALSSCPHWVKMWSYRDPRCVSKGGGRGWLTFPTNPGLGWGWRPETGAW